MSLESNEIVVNSGSYEFKFKVPTLRDEAKISTRVQAYIWKDAEGEAPVKEENLGAETVIIYRSAATFELLLKQSSAPWAFVEDPQSKEPMVNPNLPAESIQVYLDFLTKLSEFFRSGASDKNSGSPAKMESQPNTGVKPV